jgi:hypothetical protein
VDAIVRECLHAPTLRAPFGNQTVLPRDQVIHRSEALHTRCAAISGNDKLEAAPVGVEIDFDGTGLRGASKDVTQDGYGTLITPCPQVVARN